MQRVVNGAKISNWACVNFCEDLSNNSIGQFCLRLAEMSRITGVVIYFFSSCLLTLYLSTNCPKSTPILPLTSIQELDNLKLPIFTARPDQVEDDIRTCYQGAQNNLRGQKIDLLLAVLPDKNSSLYGTIYDWRQFLLFGYIYDMSDATSNHRKS